MPSGRQIVEFRIRVDCRRLTAGTSTILHALLRSLFTRFRIEADEAIVAFTSDDDRGNTVLKSKKRS